MLIFFLIEKDANVVGAEPTRGNVGGEDREVSGCYMGGGGILEQCNYFTQSEMRSHCNIFSRVGLPFKRIILESKETC